MTKRFLVACAFALVVLIYAASPGSLASLFMPIFFFAIVFVPAFLLLLAVSKMLGLTSGPQRTQVLGTTRENYWYYAALVLVVLIALVILLPTRIAVLCSKSRLEQLAVTAGEWRFDGKQQQISVGLFDIDRYIIDERGGTYFRTATGPDGIGPDTTSFGLAFNPNEDGTPFGDAHYGLSHLFGSWYRFEASNDW